MNVIDAKYLTKVYKNGEYALKNCTFSVIGGEFLVIVGASGSGKSTLLKLLAGTESLSSGELYLNGILSDNIPISKRDVSMVFQEYALYPHMTVFDNLATPIKMTGENEKKVYDRVMEALRVFGLEVAADVKPKNLSGGERQRVALAKALLKRSKLVLLDEPMSNVDEKSRLEYCHALKKMKRLLPESTFIYVTHNTREAMFLADRIAVMRDGAIIQISPKDLLLKYPEHLEILEILGCAGARFDASYDGVGLVSDEDLSDVNLPLADYSGLTVGQNITVCQSTADEESYHLFDGDGRSISLPITEITLSASLSDGILEFAGVNVELGREYLSRLLRLPTEVRVGLVIDKLSKIPLADSVPLIFEVVENLTDHVVLKIQGKSFVFSRRTGLGAGERIRLYYKISDFILYEGRERLTCHYPLRRRLSVSVIDDKGGVVDILGKRIKLDRSLSKYTKYTLITEGGFELSYDKGKCSVLVNGCLDEEFINGKKLSYVEVKGSEKYLSVISEKTISCFDKKQVWININPHKLEFEKTID